jgi:predicted lipoprotein with Yx(FWY)xxD motif
MARADSEDPENTQRRRERRTMSTSALHPKRVALPALALGVLALAGCGSHSGSSSTATGGQDSGTVVTVSDASGHSVLVNADGKALYISDQEKGGKVLCTSGACGAIWTPLTVTSKSSLTAPPPLAKKLGTVARPDGSTQVTLDDRPLYTFSFDHSAGEVNGDGTRDSFDGTNFVWHVATPSGKAASSASSSSTTAPSSPYGIGGYSY